MGILMFIRAIGSQKKIIDEIAALPKVVNINGKDETGFLWTS